MRRHFTDQVISLVDFYFYLFIYLFIFRVEILMRQYYKLFKTKREMLVSFKPADYK